MESRCPGPHRRLASRRRSLLALVAICLLAFVPSAAAWDGLDPDDPTDLPVVDPDNPPDPFPLHVPLPVPLPTPPLPPFDTDDIDTGDLYELQFLYINGGGCVGSSCVFAGASAGPKACGGTASAGISVNDYSLDDGVYVELGKGAGAYGGYSGECQGREGINMDL